MQNTFSKFDAVVMLTWSDWKTELRSNRYHYATRFARLLPVIFVQPDLDHDIHTFEQTDFLSITILHVSKKYTKAQTNTLLRALKEKNISSPLIWIYNYRFYQFLALVKSPFRVYHATEDYFSDAPHAIAPHSILRKEMASTLSYVDLLISVSEGVEHKFVIDGQYLGERLVVTNGCDYKFYANPDAPFSSRVKNAILYQGNINSKLDFHLLNSLITSNPDYEYWFCGSVSDCESKWNKIIAHKNVKYLGVLDCDALKKVMHQAALGIIPFHQNEYIINSSFPLKTFEYLACGLPVVTVPIKSLQKFSDVLFFASNTQEFEIKIKEIISQAHNVELIKKRMATAANEDYDLKFQQIADKIEQTLVSTNNASSLNVLVLYDKNSTHVSTILEYLHAFKRYSKNAIFYANATSFVDCNIDLSAFDVIVIHYSIRVNTINTSVSLSSSYYTALKNFNGYKVLFIQDEYDTTDVAKNHILDLGIHVVYTNVPHESVHDVYPLPEFETVEFITTLTGFVPEQLMELKTNKPLNERKFMIGYRGRNLPYWYGDLGQEKLFIGTEMKKICAERNVYVDIEWEENKRIYGSDWYDFLSNCRATLGTESGSNVFDFTGEISRNIRLALKKNPQLSYEEVHQKFLVNQDGKIQMNQISPKIFESIALRTALILFEGNYSGIVKPHLHYIELKKDFSNIDEVLIKLQDDDYLAEITERSYQDIVLSGRYSYKHFIAKFDDHLGVKVIRRRKAEIIPVVFAIATQSLAAHTKLKWQVVDNSLSTDVLTKQAVLSVINPIYQSTFRINLALIPRVLIRCINFITASSLLDVLKKVDEKLPGEPIKKGYWAMKRILKI